MEGNITHWSFKEEVLVILCVLWHCTDPFRFFLVASRKSFSTRESRCLFHKDTGTATWAAMFFKECKLSVMHPRGRMKSKINRALVEGRQTLDNRTLCLTHFFITTLVSLSVLQHSQVKCNN